MIANPPLASGDLSPEDHVNPSETAAPNLPAKSLAGDSSLDPRELLAALEAVRNGDFTAHLPGDRTGLAGKIADTFNEIVACNRRMANELERIGMVVGREGQTRHRVTLPSSSG